MQEPRGSEGGTAVLGPAAKGVLELEGEALGGELEVEGEAVEVLGEEGALKGHQCDQCSKSFQQASNLNRHQATLHVPKAVNCSKAHCDRIFSTLWEMLLHKAECRWVCRECGFTTSRAGYLVDGHLKRCAGLL
jgi:hypothetical protein